MIPFQSGGREGNDRDVDQDNRWGFQATYADFLRGGGDAVCILDAFDLAQDGCEILVSGNIFKTAIKLFVFPVEESNVNVILGNVEIVIFFLQ